jgi:hypothetical protein
MKCETGREPFLGKSTAALTILEPRYFENHWEYSSSIGGWASHMEADTIHIKCLGMVGCFLKTAWLLLASVNRFAKASLRSGPKVISCPTSRFKEIK